MKQKKALHGTILDFNEMKALLTPEFRRTKKIVFTNGCFDILHSGHIHYLKKAAEMGDILIIGLNSDESVSRLKGPERPVNSQSDRAAMLTALRMVDYVVIFDDDTPLNLITMVKPDFLVKGGDYKPEQIAGYDVVTKNGGKVVTIPLLKGYSSSSIISRMK